MVLQQFLRDLVDDIKEDGPKQTVKELHEEYMIDQRELGKIMVIASFALFIASVPSALTLQEAHDSVEKANNQYDNVQGIVESDRFQENIDRISSRLGGNLGQAFSQAASALEESNQRMKELDNTEDKLQTRAETYKWLSLISILGLVSGFVTIYV